MSEYHENAERIAKEIGLTMRIRFSAHAPFFEEAEISRDIFNVTLKCKGFRYDFKFGQSIAQSTGLGTNVPTLYDVLACLTKSDPGTFENFCADYGYNTDSRKAEKTYKAVRREWLGVKRIFRFEEDLEKIQEIA